MAKSKPAKEVSKSPKQPQKRPVGRPSKSSAWRRGKTASGKPVEVQPVTVETSALGSIAKLPELDGEFSLSDHSPLPLGELLAIIEAELRTALPNRKKMNSAGAWRASLLGFRCRQLMRQIHALRAQGADIEQAVALGISLGRCSIGVQVAEKEPDYVAGRKYREASHAGAKGRKKPKPPMQELDQRLQSLLGQGLKRTTAIEKLANENDVSPRTVRKWLVS